MVDLSKLQKSIYDCVFAYIYRIFLARESDIQETIDGAILWRGGYFIMPGKGKPLSEPKADKRYSTKEIFYHFHADGKPMRIRCEDGDIIIRKMKSDFYRGSFARKMYNLEYGDHTELIDITYSIINKCQVYKAPLSMPKSKEHGQIEAFLAIDKYGNQAYLKRTVPLRGNEFVHFEEIDEDGFKRFCK